MGGKINPALTKSWFTLRPALAAQHPLSTPTAITTVLLICPRPNLPVQSLSALPPTYFTATLQRCHSLRAWRQKILRQTTLIWIPHPTRLNPSLVYDFSLHLLLNATIDSELSHEQNPIKELVRSKTRKAFQMARIQVQTAYDELIASKSRLRKAVYTAILARTEVEISLAQLQDAQQEMESLQKIAPLVARIDSHDESGDSLLEGSSSSSSELEQQIDGLERWVADIRSRNATNEWEGWDVVLSDRSVCSRYLTLIIVLSIQSHAIFAIQV